MGRGMIVAIGMALAACGKHETAAPAEGTPTTTAPAPAAATRVGEVTAVTGDVTVTTPAKSDKQPVTAGMIVTRDMTFHTGAGASLDVRFDNHYTWSLGENRERALADLAIIDRPPAPEVPETAERAPRSSAPEDDPDRTASAGRHAERTAAETPAETMVKPVRPKTPAHPPGGPMHDDHQDIAPKNSVHPLDSAECDEVACTINPDTPCCKHAYKSGSAPDKGGGAPDALPDQLTAHDIKAGIQAVAPRVMACFDKEKSDEGVVVKVTIVIGADGTVTSATITGDRAGTPLATCITEAVKTAKFPRAANATTVHYPFVKR